MAAAAELERARRVGTALEASLELEEEDGNVPGQLQHLLDSRRKQKLLLGQLRVLRQVLGVLETPQAPPSSAPTSLRQEVSEARRQWQQLKEVYRGALEQLGGALPPTITQLGRGQHLLGGLQQQQELLVKLCQARQRLEQLQQQVQERRKEQLSRQGALRGLQGAAARVGSGCCLLQYLAGSPPATGDPPRALQSQS